MVHVIYCVVDMTCGLADMMHGVAMGAAHMMHVDDELALLTTYRVSQKNVPLQQWVKLGFLNAPY